MEKVIFEPSWVESARAGEQDALTGLYTSTYHDVYLTIKMMLRQDEDTVMDLLQDTYIKAFSKLDTLGDDSKFPTWVRTIARNKALDYLKKKKPLLFTETLDEYGEVVWEQKETNISVLPEDALDQKDTSAIFKEILDSIPEKQRLVITMYYYMEMSQPHIARTLGISEGTVKSRLSYGKKAIESKIYEVEKRDGIRLHTVAPFTFFLWLLHKEESNAMQPDSNTLAKIMSLSQQVDDSTSKFDGEHDLNKEQTDNTDASSAGSEGAAGNTSSTITGEAVKRATQAAGSTAAKSAGVKIVAAIAAIGVIGGGAAYGVYRLNGAQEVEDAKVSDEDVAAGTEAGGSSESDELEAAYEAYAEVYRQIENEYGEYQGETLNQYDGNGSLVDSVSYADGVFYSDLIDFTGDTIPELLMACSNVSTDENQYPALFTGIWSFNNGYITEIYQNDDLPFIGGDYSGACIAYTVYNDTAYLVSGRYGAVENIEFLEWNEDEFTPAITFEWDPGAYNMIDHSSVSEQEYRNTLDEWMTGYKEFAPYAMPTEYAGGFKTNPNMLQEALASISETKATLGLDDSENTSIAEDTQDNLAGFDEIINEYSNYFSGNITLYDTTLYQITSESDFTNWLQFGGDNNDSGYYTGSGQYYYAYFDVNQDGVDELLILQSDLDPLTNKSSIILLDIWGIENEQITLFYTYDSMTSATLTDGPYVLMENRGDTWYWEIDTNGWYFDINFESVEPDIIPDEYSFDNLNLHSF